MSPKQQVKVIQGDKYGRATDKKYFGLNLDEAVNLFIQSGVYVSAPPQIAANESGVYVMLSYEQLRAPGVNDHDRAQRSLTKEAVERYEARNKAECERRGIPYDGGEEKSPRNRTNPWRGRYEAPPRVVWSESGNPHGLCATPPDCFDPAVDGDSNTKK